MFKSGPCTHPFLVGKQFIQFLLPWASFVRFACYLNNDFVYIFKIKSKHEGHYLFLLSSLVLSLERADSEYDCRELFMANCIITRVPSSYFLTVMSLLLLTSILLKNMSY